MTPAGGNWKELYHTAQNGNLELVRYHLSQGVDIDYQHPEFMTTPLIATLEKQHYKIAKFLLLFGPTLNFLNLQSHFILYYY